MHQGHQVELVVLQHGSDFSQDVHVEEVGQESDDDDVPDLHQPAGGQTSQADGIGVISMTRKIG